MTCVGCGERRATSTCSQCAVARYCTAACQRAHWPAHKAECIASRHCRAARARSLAEPRVASRTLFELGLDAFDDGDNDGALALFAEALALGQTTHEASAPIALCYNAMGNVHCAARRASDALAMYEAALRVLRRLEPGLHVEQLAETMENVARAHALLGAHDCARAARLDALAALNACADASVELKERLSHAVLNVAGMPE